MLLLYKGAQGYGRAPFFFNNCFALCVFLCLSLFVVCFFSSVVLKLIIVSLHTIVVLLPFPLQLFPFPLLQFPFTLCLLFLCATIATCFKYLLLHTIIVIVLFLYVRAVLYSLFAFCRLGFRIWGFSW